MIQKVIIAGTTPFSSLMRCYLEKDDAFEVVAYTVESRYKTASVFDELPVIELECLKEQYSPEEYVVLNTIGYTAMNRVREKIAKLIKDAGFQLISYVHPSSVVNSSLGEGCIVLENSSIGFRNKIGKGVIIWSNVVIPHDCTVGDFSYWSPGATSCGNVEIGPCCFIGANAVLRNRIVIAEECLIGAGVYLSCSANEPQSVFSAPSSEKRKISSRRIF